MEMTFGTSVPTGGNTSNGQTFRHFKMILSSTDVLGQLSLPPRTYVAHGSLDILAILSITQKKTDGHIVWYLIKSKFSFSKADIGLPNLLKFRNFTTRWPYRLIFNLKPFFQELWFEFSLQTSCTLY